MTLLSLQKDQKSMGKILNRQFSATLFGFLINKKKDPSNLIDKSKYEKTTYYYLILTEVKDHIDIALIISISNALFEIYTSFYWIIINNFAQTSKK